MKPGDVRWLTLVWLLVLATNSNEVGHQFQGPVDEQFNKETDAEASFSMQNHQPSDLVDTRDSKAEEGPEEDPQDSEDGFILQARKNLAQLKSKLKKLKPAVVTTPSPTSSPKVALPAEADEEQSADPEEQLPTYSPPMNRPSLSRKQVTTRARVKALSGVKSPSPLLSPGGVTSLPASGSRPSSPPPFGLLHRSSIKALQLEKKKQDQQERSISLTFEAQDAELEWKKSVVTHLKAMKTLKSLNYKLKQMTSANAPIEAIDRLVQQVKHQTRVVSWAKTESDNKERGYRLKQAAAGKQALAFQQLQAQWKHELEQRSQKLTEEMQQWDSKISSLQSIPPTLAVTPPQSKPSPPPIITKPKLFTKQPKPKKTKSEELESKGGGDIETNREEEDVNENDDHRRDAAGRQAEKNFDTDDALDADENSPPISGSGDGDSFTDDDILRSANGNTRQSGGEVSTMRERVRREHRVRFPERAENRNLFREFLQSPLDDVPLQSHLNQNPDSPHDEDTADDDDDDDEKDLGNPFQLGA